jgi:hypothetical protein
MNRNVFKFLAYPPFKLNAVDRTSSRPNTFTLFFRSQKSSSIPIIACVVQWTYVAAHCSVNMAGNAACYQPVKGRVSVQSNAAKRMTIPCVARTTWRIPTSVLYSGIPAYDNALLRSSTTDLAVSLTFTYNYSTYCNHKRLRHKMLLHF